MPYLEELSRTDRGNWFLISSRIGYGGPERRRDDARIKPLDADAAFAWLLEFQETELLQKYFPDRITEG